MATPRLLRRLAVLCAAAALAGGRGALAQQLIGNVSAVVDLIERVLPGESGRFALSLGACAGAAPPPCFTIADGAVPGASLALTASSASELSAGVGLYLREFLNVTIGWPRGGGSRVVLPPAGAPWPAVGTPVTRRRAAPFSYIENVCTHSYSLAWYDWPAWEKFIDWMALSGVNLVLSMTGQEEVQYKVFSQFGLSDEQIRTWFNGPALLTWSRGQNEYGSNIAGPLPRSWMQAQWALQRQILARQRSLGIVGELPGFQGNVPAALKDIEKDSNMTVQGDTAWMYSVDPLFGKIADAWMQTLIADFGTDHWYQLDGYFNGGTAPWRGAKRRLQGTGGRAVEYALPSRPSRPVRAGNPPCTWSGVVPGYLAGCDRDCESFATLAEAQAACIADAGCGGVTVPPAGGRPELRASNVPQASPTSETSYYITNELECHGAPPDPVWKELGAAAYAGLARTDPDAVWSFQGWAIIDWNSAQQASSFRGFVDAVPDGHFVVIDMSTDGTGEWLKWDNASFFGAPFVWTSLHDFGGTDGMKGDLVHANALPFAGLPAYGGANTTVIGSGYTPEGIDQNPVYYELVAQAAFRDGPVRNLTAHAIDRARRRYGLGALPGVAPGVDAAWAALVGSTYAQDLSVQDGTGVAHLPGSDTSQFLPDRYTPTPRLCATFRAWEALLGAAAAVGDAAGEPFRYDLVNLGRELLAQLSTPMSHNFSDALKAVPLQPAALAAAGGKYAELLRDIDALVATDAAFLVGPVLAAARAWGDGHADCAKGTVPAACPDFYEWNARTQITTWNPVPAPDSPAIPDGPDDYAAKHWSGLIADFYAVRAELILAQAQADAAAGRPLNGTAVDAIKAAHAYAWQNDVAPYPVEPVGDAVGVSVEMVAKWGGAFAPYC